jgi:hypothetical protein
MSTVQERKEKKQQEAEEKKALQLRLLDAKARIFPQFVADYYDAKEAKDKEAMKQAKSICKDIYKSLENYSVYRYEGRKYYKYNELATCETYAYLRQRFPDDTDLQRRCRLATFLKAMTGDKWIRIACEYRGIRCYNFTHIPPEVEVIGWPGPVGFPDPK